MLTGLLPAGCGLLSKSLPVSASIPSLDPKSHGLLTLKKLHELWVAIKTFLLMLKKSNKDLLAVASISYEFCGLDLLCASPKVRSIRLCQLS